MYICIYAHIFVPARGRGPPGLPFGGSGRDGRASPPEQSERAPRDRDYLIYDKCHMI